MKVLIISHNPLTKQSNMGITFQSLFAAFSREELCQLYVYPTLPDEESCNSFYRITDKDALKSVLTRKTPGREITSDMIRPGHGAFENANDESLYRSRKNKSALRRIGRDLIWKLSGWYSRDLKRWLQKEKPDRIFVAPGVAKFIYDIALKISNKMKIPIVTYICDEYYFVNRPDSVFERLRLRLLQNKIEALMANTSHLVAISKEIQQSYAEKFGVDSTVIMTGAGGSIANEPKVTECPDTISYFGNIRCNRFMSLVQIGKALEQYNKNNGSNCRLKIYSFEKDSEILGLFSDINCVELHQAVTGDAFREVFSQSQLLLHTEAFDEKSVDSVKNSISTKIADSLASGIPLLAYGPEEVASMQHLKRNDSALTAFSREMLPELLEIAFNDSSACRQAAQRGLETARIYHDPVAVTKSLRHILESAE